MRYAMLLAVVAAAQLVGKCPAPPKGEPRIARPALWWSGIGPISDGGARLDPSSTLVTDEKTFAKLWKQLELKGDIPRVNFRTYFVVVVFRAGGLDFGFGGGLVINDRGDAKVQ